LLLSSEDHPALLIKHTSYTGHLESVQLRYEKITWLYKDGNIQFTDAWNERATA